MESAHTQARRWDLELWNGTGSQRTSSVGDTEAHGEEPLASSREVSCEGQAGGPCHPPPHQGSPCDPVGERAEQSGGSSEFLSRHDRSLVLKARFTNSRRSSGLIEAAAWAV